MGIHLLKRLLSHLLKCSLTRAKDEIEEKAEFSISVESATWIGKRCVPASPNLHVSMKVEATVSL